MKILYAFSLLLFVTNSYACMDLQGSFYDDESESIRTISQVGCESTTWSDADGSTTLIADGQERVLQQEGKMVAYATVYFNSLEFIIDIRMDYGGKNEFDLPTRFLTSYRIDKFNNLVERIEPFKEDGTELGTQYVTFRRVK
jgi:hypothetical protein